MARKKFRIISIPDGLYTAVEKYLQSHPKLGYSSIAEYVKQAIREQCKKDGISLTK